MRLGEERLGYPCVVGGQGTGARTQGKVRQRVPYLESVPGGQLSGSLNKDPLVACIL